MGGVPSTRGRRQIGDLSPSSAQRHRSPPASGAIATGHTIVDATVPLGRAEPAKWLVKAIARGVTWYDDLLSGRAASMRDIARSENVSERYVAQLIRLAFIEPKRVAAVLDGSTALRLTSAEIASGLDLPLSWHQQASIL